MMFIFLGSTASVGAVIGYFMTKMIKVGVSIIGCWTGVLMAVLLDSFISSFLHLGFVLYLLIVIFVVLFGWLAYRYFNYVLIFSTSIIGSYFFIRGISLIFGGYPNEVDLLDNFEVEWPFYLYVTTMIILSLVGVVVQVRRLNNSKSKVKNKSEDKTKDQNKTEDSDSDQKGKKKNKKGKRKLKIRKNKDPDIEGNIQKKSYAEMSEEGEEGEDDK
jgi:hypothetical protein